VRNAPDGYVVEVKPKTRSLEQKKIDEFGVEAIAMEGRAGTGFAMRAVCTVDEIGKWVACKRGESEDGLWCKYLQADGDGCDLYNKGTT
jgi:hypothetical protein